MTHKLDQGETLTFSGRTPAGTIGQAAVAGILANAAFTTVLPTCVTVDEVHEYAAARGPAAHRRGAGAHSRAVAAQLRSRKPLCDAAEVERLTCSDVHRPPASAAGRKRPFREVS